MCKFIKWYLKEHRPKQILIELIMVIILTCVIASPFVLYAALAGLEYYLWGTKWIAYMGVVLYYGTLIAIVFSFPIGAIVSIRRRYKMYKRREDGIQK